MKALLKNYRQSPRKVRLVTEFVKGKNVKRALAELKVLTKRASEPVKKVIESAVANATNNSNIDKESLIIKEITVNEGVVLKRYRPRYGGRATAIKKRTSHIEVTLGEEGEKLSLKNKKSVKKKIESKTASTEKKVVKKTKTSTPKAVKKVDSKKIEKNKKDQ